MQHHGHHGKVMMFYSFHAEVEVHDCCYRHSAMADKHVCSPEVSGQMSKGKVTIQDSDIVKIAKHILYT